MSKPKTLVRNSDKSYRHIHAGNWKIYSVNHPDVPNGIAKLHSSKGWIAFDADQHDLATVSHEDYLYGTDMKHIVLLLDMQKVPVKNIMNGEMMEESLTLPYCCSVASESFWSA